MSYVLALDQGTTSTRAIVFDETGAKIAIAQLPLPQIFPKPGWVEHDAVRIWDDQFATACKALKEAEVAPEDLSGIGVANQRETVVVWDRSTGRPIHNAIVWQDRRTAEICDRLLAEGHDPMLRERTGLGVDPYYSATKIAWILDTVEGARTSAENGNLACGTIDSWLVYNLTGGKIHVTDVTNASRTQLLDISSATWDSELCDLFNVPQGMLPKVVRSSEIVGRTSDDLLGAQVPICGICGDQQAALVGNGGFSAGAAKATFGTGIFALMHTGSQRVSSHVLSTTIAAQVTDKLEYALEGSIFMGGAVIQWLVEGLELAASPRDMQALAQSVPDSGGVIFVPALTGLGAPVWDPYARGTIVGLTRGSTAAHIARAGMEAIPLQVSDLLDVMIEDSGRSITTLRADGGVTVNELIMQTLADVLGIPIDRAQVAESTALGVTYLAGLSTGVWNSPDDLPALTGVGHTFEPDSAEQKRLAEVKMRWADAVERAKGWEK